MGEERDHGGCVAQLVEDEGGVGGAEGDLRHHGLCALCSVVVVDGVAGGIGDDVCVPGVVDGDDCEALAGDGGGEDVVIEAGDAIARGEKEDGGSSRGEQLRG